MNILIVKLSAIGDVTHTLPALVALRRHHPAAHIAWLIEEASAEVIAGHDALNRVLVFPRRQFMALWNSGRWIAAFRVWRDFRRQVRDTRYDLVLDFQALIKSGIWVAQARADRKVGFGRGLDHAEGSWLFLTERIPAPSMEVHALDRGLRLLEAIGVPTGPVEYRFPIGAEAEQRVQDFLDKEGCAGPGPLVAVHPMTRWETKLWPDERFAAVADALLDRNLRVVFTGAAGDTPRLDAICARMQRRAARMDGRGGLKMLAALYHRADAVLSTDTGPMHVAAAVGTPVVALFGPTAPNRTGPYGPEHIVLRAGVPCSPCFKRACQTTVVEPMACMRRIETGAVVDAVFRQLSRKGSHVPAS